MMIETNSAHGHDDGVTLLWRLWWWIDGRFPWFEAPTQPWLNAFPTGLAGGGLKLNTTSAWLSGHQRLFGRCAFKSHRSSINYSPVKLKRGTTGNHSNLKPHRWWSTSYHGKSTRGPFCVASFNCPATGKHMGRLCILRCAPKKGPWFNRRFDRSPAKDGLWTASIQEDEQWSQSTLQDRVFCNFFEQTGSHGFLRVYIYISNYVYWFINVLIHLFMWIYIYIHVYGQWKLFLVAGKG